MVQTALRPPLTGLPADDRSGLSWTVAPSEGLGGALIVP